MLAIFLNAQWRHLALLNYVVDPDLLKPLIPNGTELDEWGDKAYVSLVAFLFEQSKIFGVPIPFHGSFEGVNLRFYVRRRVDGEWRRGVVFIKELVPKSAVTLVARKVYHENYSTVTMGHQKSLDSQHRCRSIRYWWGDQDNGCRLSLDLQNAENINGDKRARFFADHFWGYSRRSGGRTIEYRVDHPSWQLSSPQHFELTGDMAMHYGSEFGQVFTQSPESVVFADGSEISVHRGVVL